MNSIGTPHTMPKTEMVRRVQKNFGLNVSLETIQSEVKRIFGVEVTYKDFHNAKSKGKRMAAPTSQPKTTSLPVITTSSTIRMPRDGSKKRYLMAALRADPNASDSKLLTWVKKLYGVTVCRSYVINVRNQMKMNSSMSVGSKSKESSGITLNSIQMVKSLISEVGGFATAQKLLEAVGR